jgi:hypothetical protein
VRGTKCGKVTPPRALRQAEFLEELHRIIESLKSDPGLQCLND